MQKLLMKLVEIPVLGKRICAKIVKREGGSQESIFLREYTKKKYNVDIGMYSYGGCFDYRFNLGGRVEIGNYCSFATDIHYFGGNHPTEYASTSPYFYNKSFGFNVKDIPREKLRVGHDVWCGYGVIITSKCHNIGNGSVIAAGSIVTSDVPPYTIVVGSPAKVLRYRFDDETIEALEKSKWYLHSPKQLMKYYDSIANPLEFATIVFDELSKG